MWVGVLSQRDIGKKKLWVIGLEFEETAGFHSVAHRMQRWVDLERKFANINLWFSDQFCHLFFMRSHSRYVKLQPIACRITMRNLGIGIIYNRYEGHK